MADLSQRQFQEEEHVQNDDATLFDRYGQAILSYACLHTPSREDAEDITLEVFDDTVGAGACPPTPTK